MSLAALFRLHQGLPREAPGSEAETLAALARLRPHLPACPRVADLGCGTGPATLLLARELRVPVLALDLHRPFLARLQGEARARGLPVRPVQGDLARLPFAPASLDLVWCEGAAYLLGLGPALAAMRALLRPGGLVALSECCWLTEARPPQAAAFWREEYPAMTTLEGCAEQARAAGFELLEARALPPGAWEEYYGPLAARGVAALRPEAGRDPELAAVLDETARELAVWRGSEGSYGYAWLLLRG